MSDTTTLTHLAAAAANLRSAARLLGITDAEIRDEEETGIKFARSYATVLHPKTRTKEAIRQLAKLAALVARDSADDP